MLLSCLQLVALPPGGQNKFMNVGSLKKKTKYIVHACATAVWHFSLLARTIMWVVAQSPWLLCCVAASVFGL